MEWADGLGGRGEWSAEAFDREQHESYMRAHADLPEGAQLFLHSMFLEPWSPYLMRRACNEGFLGLFGLADQKSLDVEAPPDCQGLKEGDLLLKPALPLLLAFWKTMMSLSSQETLPLAAYGNDLGLPVIPLGST